MSDTKEWTMAARRRRRVVRRRPLDVFDNPFATRDSDGVRRIHRNDGRWAKPTWSTRRGVRARKNPSIYANPSKDARGRVHKNNGQFAKPPWSKGKAAKRVRARHHAPIPWEKRMLAARRKAMKARKNPSRRNPFLDTRNRVHRNDGRFAKSPYSMPRDWMTTEHGRIPWLPARANPSGWGNRDMDLIFDNPRGRKPAKKKPAKRKTAAKKPAKRKVARRAAPKKPAKRKAAKRRAPVKTSVGTVKRVYSKRDSLRRYVSPFRGIRMHSAGHFRSRKLRKPTSVRMARSTEPMIGQYRFGVSAHRGAPVVAPFKVPAPRESAYRRAAPRSHRITTEAYANPTRRRKGRKTRRTRRTRR